MLTIKNLSKSYEEGKVKALDNLSLFINQGEIVALMGPSGCGKSTLLNLIGALDSPDSGEIFIQDRPIDQYTPFNKYRSEMIGFVFQSHYLIPSMTLLENVELPMYTHESSRNLRRNNAEMMLKETGLADRMHFYPNSVSGGERQRAAIARSLVNNPEIVLADEPTGSLDSKTGVKVISFLINFCLMNSTTMIMATHNPVVSNMAQQTMHMNDGRII